MNPEDRADWLIHIVRRKDRDGDYKNRDEMLSWIRERIIGEFSVMEEQIRREIEMNGKS